MNFAAIVGSLLRSGYALPTQRPDNGALQNQLADDPLIESEMLSRLSRPPLFTPGIWKILHAILQAFRAKPQLEPVAAVVPTIPLS